MSEPLSKPFGKFNSCLRKVQYTSKIKAMNVLRRIKKSGRIVENAHAYHCQHCNKYHLGHIVKEVM